MMALFMLLVIPALGVVWFACLTSFLTKLKHNRDTLRPVLLGSVVTFLLLFCIMLVLMELS
ncbi:hypothetical protein [Paenibacillus sp. H1-7]|uniref:hypothetical protein n=1 Tax=Paenibacillus sp. H1-7 TaxID=2282849 RepID=UPI001EF9285A|nr:hypothetical protein [Paenibacillus sp. H1-7]